MWGGPATPFVPFAPNAAPTLTKTTTEPYAFGAAPRATDNSQPTTKTKTTYDNQDARDLRFPVGPLKPEPSRLFFNQWAFQESFSVGYAPQQPTPLRLTRKTRLAILHKKFEHATGKRKHQKHKTQSARKKSKNAPPVSSLPANEPPTLNSILNQSQQVLALPKQNNSDTRSRKRFRLHERQDSRKKQCRIHSAFCKSSPLQSIKMVTVINNTTSSNNNYYLHFLLFNEIILYAQFQTPTTTRSFVQHPTSSRAFLAISYRNRQATLLHRFRRWIARVRKRRGLHNQSRIHSSKKPRVAPPTTTATLTQQLQGCALAP